MYINSYVYASNICMFILLLIHIQASVGQEEGWLESGGDDLTRMPPFESLPVHTNNSANNSEEGHNYEGFGRRREFMSRWLQSVSEAGLEGQ